VKVVEQSFFVFGVLEGSYPLSPSFGEGGNIVFFLKPHSFIVFLVLEASLGFRKT
jgi:hypothetical protein